MPKTAWQAFYTAIKSSKWLVIWMWIILFLGHTIAFTLPYILKLVVDLVTSLERTVIFADLSPYIIAILFVLIMQELSFRTSHFLEIIINNRIIKHTYPRLFGHLLDRPSSYFENKFAGELAKRIEQIVTGIGHFISQFPWYISYSIPALISSAVLLYIAHPYLALGYVVVVSVFFLLSYPLLKRQYVLSEALTSITAWYDGRRHDVLGNISLVHSFATNFNEKESCQIDTNKVAKKLWDEEIWFVLNKLLQGLTVITMAGVLLLVSFYLFTLDQITIGDFVLVISTIPVFTNVVWNIGDNVLVALRNYASISDAVVGLRTELESLPEGVIILDSFERDISVADVSFRYPGTKEGVLQNFSLNIPPGQKLGIVGSSGAGKSTLIKLLLRQYDADSGTITIGEQNIKDVTLESLRQSISFVPQDTTLFHRSLFENIQYAKPDATLDEVIEVSKRAHTHDFIESLPEQYDTLVGERGVKLSGGQRQRIAIARAMLKDAPILVLDEATSALDGESEEIVQAGFRELFAGRTVIAVAHRLSTLREMDRIVVIEEGKIVEDGAPNELLQIDNGIFKAKWEQQKGGFV